MLGTIARNLKIYAMDRSRMATIAIKTGAFYLPMGPIAALQSPTVVDPIEASLRL
jgi:hypothetical protein